jgi:acyloxyacyl hydrolase
VESLAYLDAHLAPGSYVLFLGLVDGRVLYDTMAKLQHPIGAPYANVYDYLNCLDTNPCW